MVSPRRYAVSSDVFLEAVKEVNYALLEYRKPAGSSGSVHGSVPSTELVGAVQDNSTGEFCTEFERASQAVREDWRFLLTNIENWQILEEVFPGQSESDLDSGVRWPSSHWTYPSIGDLTGLRRFTSAGIEVCIDEAANGSAPASERLYRLKIYHKTIDRTIDELLGYYRDDLYKLVSTHYTLTRDTINGWAWQLKLTRRFGGLYHSVTSSIEEVISLAHMEQVFWRQLERSVDRRTRLSRAFEQQVNDAKERCDRVEWILRQHVVVDDRLKRRQ